MYSASISKRTFFKSLGLLAILGMIAPWFRKSEIDIEDSFPVEVRKEPKAISRTRNSL
jgi:hypothetical protein